MSEASSQDSATSPMATTNTNAPAAAQPNSGAAVVTANNVTNSNQNNVIVVTSTSSSGGATVVPIPAASMVSAPVQMQGTPVQIQTTNTPTIVSSAGTPGALRPQQIQTTPMQVLQQNPAQYLHQYSLQQQLMLQTSIQAAMQGQLAMQQQQQQQQQNRPSSVGSNPKSPSIMSPTGGVVIKSSNSSPITVNPNPLMATSVKGTGTIMSQATQQGKNLIQRQNSQPLVIGQLVPVSGHQLVNQSKSPTLTTQAQQVSQVLPNAAGLRLTSQQTLVTNTGHILSGQPTMITNPAMLNHLQFSPHLMSQETLRAMALQQNQLSQPSLLTTQQAATILSSQPLYIRAATPLQHQQGIVGSVQNVVPATSKGKAMDVQPANIQIKASLMSQQKFPANITKGTQHVLPSVTRVVNQAGTPLVTAQVQPTNLTLVTSRAGIPQQKQVNRVKGKSHSKPSSPLPSSLAQARVIQTKPVGGTGQELPTVMVQPKVQQPPPHQHQNYHQQHQHIQQQLQSQLSQQHTQQQHTSQQHQHIQQLNQQQQQLSQQQTDQQKKLVVAVGASTGTMSLTTTSKVDAKTSTSQQQMLMETAISAVLKVAAAAEKPKPVTMMVLNGVNGKGNVVNGDIAVHGTSETPMETCDETTDGDPKGDEVSVATTVAVVAPGEKQKAIIKPNVLTHIIEGFVIEEGPEPFPVQRSSLLTEFIPPRNIVSVSNDSDSCDNATKDKKEKKGPIVVESDDDKPRLKCEFCGKVDYAMKFKGSKRFCSMACAKRYNVGCSKRMGLFKGRETGVKVFRKKKKNDANHQSWSRKSSGRVTTGPIQRCASEGSSATTVSTASEVTSGEDEQNSPLSPHESSPPRSPPVLEREGDLDPGAEPPRKRLAQQWSISTVDDDVRSTPEPRKPISKWSVQDVYEFIQSLTGCAVHANDFRSQEIDGQALLLLKEDHLMTAMSMKLGPALKICARINTLKDEMS